MVQPFWMFGEVLSLTAVQDYSEFWYEPVKHDGSNWDRWGFHCYNRKGIHLLSRCASFEDVVDTVNHSANIYHVEDQWRF